MHIQNIQPVSFKGITVQNGGLDFVRQEGGELAVSKLNIAQGQFADSSWNLLVTENGYNLTSPSTNKTYFGPFSVKKRFIKGTKKEPTSTLVVRMDKSNRVKYPIELPDLKSLSKYYKAIKNSKGLEKMLLLLTVLEKHI